MPPLVRERVPFERELVLRGDLRAEVELDDLRAAVERLAPLVDDLARLVPDFFAAPLERDVDFFAAPPLERFAVEREPADFFALERDVDDLRAPLEDDPELPPLADISVLHLPDITRCAASATASAISEPNLVALAMTLLAARSAVSAASRPASRIFLRAPGLAAIAAAAAVNPAASISLLIAALASLSTVLLLELELERGELPVEPDEEAPVCDPPARDRDEEVREEVLRGDLAIIYLPRSGKRHFNAVPVPE